MRYGHGSVFTAAAALAVVMYGVASLARVPRRIEAAVDGSPIV